MGSQQSHLRLISASIVGLRQNKDDSIMEMGLTCTGMDCGDSKSKLLISNSVRQDRPKSIRLRCNALAYNVQPNHLVYIGNDISIYVSSLHLPRKRDIHGSR